MSRRTILMSMRRALAQTLFGFAGRAVVITHDR